MKTRVYQSGIDSYFNEMYIENALLNIEDTINLFEKLINNDNISFADYIDTHYQAYSNMINELKTKTIRDMDIAYSSTILDVHNTFINNFPLSRSVPFVNRSIVMNSDLNKYGNIVERDAIIDFYTNLIKYNRILSESNN